MKVCHSVSMATPENINDAIETNAKGPKRVQVGNQSVEQHSIEEQIAADKHVAGRNAANRKHFGLRFTKLKPPGAV